MEPTAATATLAWLDGGGDMGELVRQREWSKTALGPIDRWSQTLRTAVNLVLGSPVPIVMLWGPEGIMIYNDAYSEFAGGRHPGLLGSPVLEGWPEVADFNRRVMDVGLGGGTLSFRDEHLILHRHGVPEDVWMNLNYSPIRDETGAPVGVFAIVVETTKRVRAEQQVRALNATLEAQVHALAELDRAKTSFFTNISHEFRTPLTLMLGPTEDALQSASRALVGKDLETVHRNQVRLLKLVNSLLEFSRIEAGRMRPVFRKTDIGQITADIAEAFRPAVERAGLTYTVTFDGGARDVYVDRDMWEKVVLNLLSNALKFTFTGTIEVRLRDLGDRVALSVADSGIGIAPDEQSRVFQRFHRIEGVRARTHEGSGIGLALVHDLVELHGGTVGLQSVPNTGTTFTVTLLKGAGHLPADQVASGDDTRRASSEAPAFVEEAVQWLPDTDVPSADVDAYASDAFPESWLSVPGTVVVVDDNPDMRAYLTRVLRRHWTVDAAADGRRALELIEAVQPDVIVTDVMMPDLDGFGLVKAVRDDERTSHIPVLVLSARAGEDARIDGLTVGADDYLTKPFSARELVARVNAQMRLAQAARERRELLVREQEARRLAEIQKQHLYALFMQTPSPIAVLRGRDYVIDLANASTCAVWGRRHEDVIHRPLFDVMPELAGQVWKPLLDRVYDTGEPHVGSETPGWLDRRGDGNLERVFFNFVYTPLRDIDGGVEGVLVIASDVTEQVRAREQLNALKDAAESANRAKDEFLAMLGHELRNPLAPILTALQLMKLRNVSVAERERAVIERQVHHVVALVDDLLDVSRITRGKVQLRRSTIEVATFVAKAIEMTSPLLEQQRHTLHVEVPASGLVVDGDEGRLAQVVANLLTNAAKYTESGGHITITAALVGEEAVIRVRDNGAGIDASMLPNVFDMFVQDRQAIDRSRGGLGLGLTIVRSLVSLHGGTVEAHSAGKGLGSEFTVRLPIAAESATAPRVQPVADGPATVDTMARVLIVDDNVEYAAILAEALSELGYRTSQVHDGVTALSAAEAFSPDVALVDIGLPLMDGYEVAARFAAHPRLKRVKLIAVTGYGQQHDRARSDAAGFAAHMVKPVDIEALRTAIDTWTADTAVSDPHD